jgi:hypothetical protein
MRGCHQGASSRPIALGGILVLAIAPLALAAFIELRRAVARRAGPFDFVVQRRAGQSALYRTFEVALGGAIAMAVSLLVFPSERIFGVDAAARMLGQLTDALPAADGLHT